MQLESREEWFTYLHNEAHSKYKRIHFWRYRDQPVSIMKTTLLTLFRGIVAAYCENHTKHVG
jgi:hypothetical protein